ncbi:hypothetical protein [Chondromyces crocatus]|uniref:Uncharacterized protein n=1 Tax=Chondromyces crocatus TaxID=52 RepID=A0A0K1ERQ7_CHOCO|nr:hypothetical protein [Chondromyces crocatus]AKT43342.1 uncharacterized protein CMC5_075740 [Chondromyces crocatus]
MRARTALAVARRMAAATALALAANACGAGSTPPPKDPLVSLRELGATARDGEAVGRWLLGELLVPGGTPERARAARKRLDEVGPRTLHGALARAVDDEAHGRFKAATDAHLDAISAARTSEHPDAPLVAWYAAHRLLTLRHSVAGLWQRGRDIVLRALDQPGNIGWRARGELVEWWSLDGVSDAPANADASTPRMDLSAKRFGCIEKARMAGPFGHLARSDHRVHFPAERPGPWPPVFPLDPFRVEAPRVLETERRGCLIAPTTAVESGVFYLETFLDLPAERDLLVAVQGAFAIFIDDVEVLTRDTRQWGVWPRFGARVRLSKGRHRILARVGGRETSMRLMTPDGLPLGLPTSDDPTPPYSIMPPERLPDPNVLEPFLTAVGVRPQPGTPPGDPTRNVADPISRWLAAQVAHIEGQDDVSSVLIEPLVKDLSRATGIALATQADFIARDPIFPETDGRDLAKDLRTRAAEKDPELWESRFLLVLESIDKEGLPQMPRQVEALADHFRDVPELMKALFGIYSRLGWNVERKRTLREAAARFPDDVDILQSLLQLQEQEGERSQADATAAHIRKLDPNADVDLNRAIKRQDWEGAIKELRRLGELRKDRKDIARRIADLLTRSGNRSESLEQLEQALVQNPTDADARMALADARFALGERDALQKALVEAIRTGSDSDQLREAIELVEGTTELSPYRQDGAKVIRDYETAAAEMPGNAARVLDYSALWVHPDGSARMLEHEIIRIQSREAIQELAEQQMPRGLVLKLRTVKRDGTILEPEMVEGKPTVTMPHLEVGDYIETESLFTLRGDGRGGRVFQGPRWFFREEKVAYWRSEFVVISPKNRPLDVEVGGDVPPAQVTESGALVTRRWRVDRNPALPEEPGSAPLSEFLPNVRIGWGMSLADTVARMVDAAADETPRDPRIVRVAQAIARDAAAAGTGTKKGAKTEGSAAELPSQDEQARRVYRWVLANVETGRETDGRRVVIGKSGNRSEAFVYLCRLLGIDASYGLVRDRLTPPPRGPMSEAETYSALAVRLTLKPSERPSTEGEAVKSASATNRWLVIREKYAPYGYLPSPLRGQPAILLVPGAPHETTATTGPADGLTSEGTAELAEDGTATVELRQSFAGKLAIGLRTALETLPDARLQDVVESKLLQQALPGARLLDMEVKNLATLDAPLVLVMKARMPNFARRQGDELVITPPCLVHLSNLATLTTRETPLYISEGVSTRSVIRFQVKLPANAELTTRLAPTSVENQGRSVMVRDRMEKGTLFFDRVLDLPAGRVQPEDYSTFQSFARKADSAITQEVVVRLGRAR